MKLKYFSALVLVTLIAFTSCKKEDFNINKNPNNPTDSTITYNVILAGALDGTGRIVANDWGWLNSYMGYWARSGGYAPNYQEETYSFTNAFQTGIWNDLYDNTYNYEVMRRKADAAGANFYAGIARIMKAHNFGLLVDFYNNVPYSQALQGSNNTTPAYDKGSDIYRDLFTQIDAGMALIKAADSSKSKDIALNDIMFKGYKPLWLKFANTLKLRLLVHLMNGWNSTTIAPGFDMTFITNQFQAIQTEGSGFLGIGENAQVNPGYKQDKPNPFWANYGQTTASQPTTNNKYYKANDYAIKYYILDGDLRYQRFYAPAKNTGEWKGIKYGSPSGAGYEADNLASIGPGLLKAYTQAQWIMTAAESMFLQAEYNERTTPGSAQFDMVSAIKESYYFLYDAYTNPGLMASIDNYVDGTYIASNAGFSDVDYTAPADPSINNNIPGGLYTIIQQKWFALNGIAPYEVYTDYRRTDITYGLGGGYDPGPPISVSPGNTTPKVPYRLLYPQSEYNFNPSNVGAQGTIDKFNRIFWDAN